MPRFASITVPEGRKRFYFIPEGRIISESQETFLTGKQKWSWSRLANFEIGLSSHSIWDPQFPPQYNPGFTAAGVRSKCPLPAFLTFGLVRWNLHFCDNTKGYYSYSVKVFISSVVANFSSQRPYPSHWAWTVIHNPNRVNDQVPPKCLNTKAD